jgi:hypothetical protein
MKKKINRKLTKQMTQKETWKELPIAPELYLVSNFGKVISKNYNRTGKPKELTNVKNSQGYLVVTLFYNKKATVHKVHRLVCLTFLDNPNNYPFVNHKNAVKTDNTIENLEWCSHQQNVDHAWANNLIVFSEEHKNRLRTINQKMVLNTNSGIYFDNIKMAAKSVNHNYIKLQYKLRNLITNDTNFILV